MYIFYKKEKSLNRRKELLNRNRIVFRPRLFRRFIKLFVVKSGYSIATQIHVREALSSPLDRDVFNKDKKGEEGENRLKQQNLKIQVVSILD